MLAVFVLKPFSQSAAYFGTDPLCERNARRLVKRHVFPRFLFSYSRLFYAALAWSDHNITSPIFCLLIIIWDFPFYFWSLNDQLVLSMRPTATYIFSGGSFYPDTCSKLKQSMWRVQIRSSFLWNLSYRFWNLIASWMSYDWFSRRRRHLQRLSSTGDFIFRTVVESWLF